MVGGVENPEEEEVVVVGEGEGGDAVEKDEPINIII